LVKALELLEPFQNGVVWRGVPLDLDEHRKQEGKQPYKVGDEVTFFGFTSTTTSLETMDDFIGGSQSCTQISLELTQHQARDISWASNFPDEAEVLLPPGCKFKVVRKDRNTQGALILWLKEVKSNDWILDLSRSQVAPTQENGTWQRLPTVQQSQPQPTASQMQAPASQTQAALSLQPLPTAQQSLLPPDQPVSLQREAAAAWSCAKILGCILLGVLLAGGLFILALWLFCAAKGGC